jgi:hypothetical protein
MSMKKMHKEIMLSSVYQLSTANDQVNAAKDSGNRLYWKAEHRRMDAEQVRDGILFVSGNLDTAAGGPSLDLTPANTRRTVYGKVSRYKLDTYLQLFDFPSPQISAEKRFTTTVPLQRLFLMNSDFVQIEAEELAKKIASEPNNRARIKKVHELVYGREPTEAEIALGLEYLSTEPLKEYEEIKAEEAKAKEKAAAARPARGGKGAGAKDAPKPEMTSEVKPEGSGATAEVAPAEIAATTEMAAKVDAKPEAKAEVKADAKPEAAKAEGEAPMPLEAAAAAAPDPDADMGNGMMGGVNGRRGGARGAAEIKYEPSAWGRYAKVLLSSSEFLFIN